MKKTSRVFLMALLVMAMLATVALPAMAADYTNVPDWASGYNKEVIPDQLNARNAGDKITRAEFAAVVYKAFEDKIESVTSAPQGTFTDTKNEAVLWAVGAQIVQGVGNSKFDPDAFITRQDISVMLERTLFRMVMSYYEIQYDNTYVILFDDPVPPFADQTEISGYSNRAVQFMVAMGIVKGEGDNKFAPKANATILETTIMVSRILENLSDITKFIHENVCGIA